jgi:uncharacterized protein DUF3224
MKNRALIIATVMRRFSTVIAFCLSITAIAWACTHPLAAAAFQKGSVMSHATGTFDVKMTPQTDDKGGDPSLSRMTIDKQFHGDLEGTSEGQMLAAGDPKTSAVYVAIEKFNGTLKGRSGTFILHHTGLMTRGVPQLSIAVAPDSGTGQLAGLAGTLTINIAADGKHSYEFEYTLPETK